MTDAATLTQSQEAAERSKRGEAAAAAATSAEFYEQMTAAKVAPLWDRYNRLTPPEPVAPDQGTQWRWKDLLPIIDRAGREISMELAERRALMLINPVFGGMVTSTTGLYGAVQVLHPGEGARAHRHTASAFRFIIEGQGGLTTVNGKPCPMNDGDLVLTPNWAWHEHSNPGSGRVCWFDGLDVPLVMFYNAWFADHGAVDNFPPSTATLPDEAYAHGGLVPVTGLDQPLYSSRIRFAWEDVQAALAATPAEDDGSRKLRYVNPITGGAVTPTMDLYALSLAAGAETRAKRVTHNTVCVAARGSGVTTMGDQRMTWEKGDIFTLPHWAWTTHTADAGGAVLFQSTDREMLSRLGLLREQLAN